MLVAFVAMSVTLVAMLVAFVAMLVTFVAIPDAFVATLVVNVLSAPSALVFSASTAASNLIVALCKDVAASSECVPVGTT